MQARLLWMSLCLMHLAQAVIAGTPLCRPPTVNKIGFRPGSLVSYMTARAPDGQPFPADLEACVDRAFDAWTRADAATGLDVRFERGAGGIVVKFDRAGGLALARKVGAAWAGGVRGAGGYLEQATIWLSADRRLLDSCDGVTKLLLHEIGHLHGLGDIRSYAGPSVMNRAARRNDIGGRIPLAPTGCDARQAWRAAQGLRPAVASTLVASAEGRAAPSRHAAPGR